MLPVERRVFAEARTFLLNYFFSYCFSFDVWFSRKIRTVLGMYRRVGALKKNLSLLGWIGQRRFRPKRPGRVALGPIRSGECALAR